MGGHGRGRRFGAVPVRAAARRAGTAAGRAWSMVRRRPLLVPVAAGLLAIAGLATLYAAATGDLHRSRSALAARTADLAASRADVAAARADLVTAKASLDGQQLQVTSLRAQFADLQARVGGLATQAVVSRAGTAAKDRTIADLNSCLDGVLAAATKFKNGDGVAGTMAVKGVDAVCNRAFSETQALH